MSNFRRLVISAALAVLVFATASAPVSIAPAAAADSTQSLGNAYLTMVADRYSGDALSPVVVQGGGFAPGSQVAVFQGGVGTPVPADAIKVPVAENSYWGPVSIPIPINSKGSLPFVAVGIGGSTDGVRATNSFAVIALSASLAITSGQGKPGTPITLSGAGFAPNESVKLTFAGSTVTVPTNALGAFPLATLTIPDVKAGSYTVDAVGLSSGATATAYQYVSAFFGTASPSQFFMLPGTKLTFSGEGWSAGETVTIAEPKGATLSTLVVPADNFGFFSQLGEITVPLSWSGKTITLQLTGSKSKVVTTVTFSVGKYFPNVISSDYYINPGKAITFTGWSFAPGETVDAYLGESTVPFASAVTNLDGVFDNAITWKAPFTGVSQADFRFVGRSSAGSAAISVTVGTLQPRVIPGSYYLMPGTATSATAVGFAELEPVTLSFPGVTLKSVTDKDGVAQFPAFSVPFGSAPVVTYTITGDLSGVVGTGTVNLGSYIPSASASSFYLLAGSSFATSGYGFAPYEKVELRQGTKLLATVAADENGRVIVPAFNIPFQTAGDQSYTLVGNSSKSSSKVTVTVGNFTPTATASNYYVQPGQIVNVWGDGFAPGEPVTYSTGGATVVADKDGHVEATPITMPFLSGNTTSLTVTLTGTLSGAVATTAIKAGAFAPQVKPSVFYGAAGGPVDFYGTGFAAGETVTGKFGTTTIGTAVADQYGAFSLLGNSLPYGAVSASYSFTGSLSKTTVSTSVGIAAVNPQVRLDPYYGFAGSTVTVDGIDFAAGEAVTISFGNAVVANAVADKNGYLSVKVTVPANATPGSKTFTLTGKTSGGSASTGYTVADPKDFEVPATTTTSTTAPAAVAAAAE